MLTLLLLLSAPLVLILALDSILRAFYLVVRFSSGSIRDQGAPAGRWQTGNPKSDIRNPESEIRLGLLLLARNEEPIIGETVQHLQQLAYPHDRYRVIVVADNCQDATATVARSAGAEVWERQQSEACPERCPEAPPELDEGLVEGPGRRVGKGAALRWFVQHADDTLDELDAIIIFDADSRVAPDFLAQISELLSQGADCIQGFLMPLPDPASPASLLAAYSELLSQHIDATARWRLGWPAQLYGTGMVFRTGLLRSLVPQLQTKIEDVELTISACGVTTPVFAPQAVVYDPKPVTTQQVVTQRARWTQGQITLWRRFWRDFAGLMFRGNSGARALIFSWLLKPKTVVFAVKLLLLGLLAGVAATYDTASVLLALLMLAVLADAVYYLIGLAWVETPLRYARALLMAPFYPAMWLWGLVVAARSGDTWLRARD